MGVFIFYSLFYNTVSAIDFEGTFTGKVINDLNGEGIKLDWENPNKNGDNPYRFSSQNILDSGLMMQVVGCTGVVDSVSKYLADLLGEIGEAGKNEIENAADEMTKQAVEVTSTQITDEQNNTKKELSKANKREQCLNGIAYTLAKNQLTDMTKYTLNWVTTGFSGDPMYVRNMQNFMTSLTDGIVKKETEMFGNIPAYPYSTSFSRSYISTYKDRIKNLENSMATNLLNYLEEGKEIEDFANNFSAGGWDGFIALTQFPQNNPLGYTMIASQKIADEEARKKEEIKTELTSVSPTLSQKKCSVYKLTKAAALRENQKKDLEDEYEEVLSSFNEINNELNIFRKNNDVNNLSEEKHSEYNNLQISYYLKNSELTSLRSQIEAIGSIDYESDIECIEWEVVTPGRFISDKVSETLGAPERQLELADTINEALNMLFSYLISKLQNEGLTSLSSNMADFGNKNLGGEGSNEGVSIFNNQSTGYGDEFDLMKSLGNTYYKSTEIGKAGEWDAKQNKIIINNETLNTGLYSGTGPKYKYYNVTIKGSTKLFNGNYGWNKGDRAFFDGKEWQKWECDMKITTIDGKEVEECQNQKLPIKEKGVIQKQQDYIVATKEAITTLPPIMPALGELDYCIPGPNPNWAYNSTEAREAYINYVEGYHVEDVAPEALKILSGVVSFLTLGVVNGFLDALGWGGATDGTMLIISPPKINSPKYNEYEKIFTESKSENIWNSLTTGNNSLMPIYGKPTFLETISPDEDFIIALENKITNIKYLVRNLIGEYEEKVNKKYFDKIQKMYIAYENRDDLNKSYISMAREGLALTKKIVNYDKSIKEAEEYYYDSITEASLKINTLKIMRAEVNSIIKKAQEARRERIKNDLNLTEAEIDDKIAELTEAGCFEDEEINYIDDYNLDFNSATERCDDGIDNDLDGDIDKNDSDCKDVVIKSLESYYCDNGIDDDNDNFVDYYDKDCNGINNIIDIPDMGDRGRNRLTPEI